jgi:EAL domain-containing protein (putative c-di-GMP-specific phosphodiesterase class I)
MSPLGGDSMEIAHSVGATIVAEGIETPEQWRFASMMGCDVAQGYLIGRPVPADELEAVLVVRAYMLEPAMQPPPTCVQ